MGLLSRVTVAACCRGAAEVLEEETHGTGGAPRVRRGARA